MWVPLGGQDLLKYEGVISGLRVNELQSLLSHFKSPKLGKKQELIHRCVTLLKAPNYQADIVKLINDMSRRNGRPAPYQTSHSRIGNGMASVPSMYTSSAHHTAGGSTMYGAQVGVSLRLVRGLRPLPLPFYDPVVTVQEPVELGAVHGIKSQQRQTIVFSVPRDRSMSLYYRSDAKPLPRHELQLRFFHLSGDWQSTEQPDDFPLNVSVRIDDQCVQLPNVIPTNKPNVEPKRPSRPVNITPYCQPPRDSSRPHRMVVEWTGDKRVWACAIYMVYRITSDILRDRALASDLHKQPRDSTKQTIIRRLGTGDDDGITMDQLKISLLCPLGKIRMGLPARCRTCTHLQCFDLDLYLKMNEKRPTWKCAVCSETAPYNKLIIDGYFQEMLRDVSSEINEVELMRDGTYQIIKEEIFDLSDDDDHPTTSASPAGASSRAVSNGSAGGAGGKKGGHHHHHVDDDIIVLDSDDDEDVQRAVAESTAAVSKVPSRHSPTRSEKSDSVVIIDLDTPPRPTPVARVAPQQSQPAPTQTPSSSSSGGIQNTQNGNGGGIMTGGKTAQQHLQEQVNRVATSMAQQHQQMQQMGAPFFSNTNWHQQSHPPAPPHSIPLPPPSSSSAASTGPPPLMYGGRLPSFATPRNNQSMPSFMDYRQGAGGTSMYSNGQQQQPPTAQLGDQYMVNGQMNLAHVLQTLQQSANANNGNFQYHNGGGQQQ